MEFLLPYPGCCRPPIDIHETARLVVVPAPFTKAPPHIQSANPSEQMIDRQRVCVIGAAVIITVYS